MDKYEYKLKLDQMKSLAADRNYNAAAEIADMINWHKIKNVNALMKAGEIYEKTGRYEESRDILLMAYDRSPIGRMIIYHLAEVAVKMGNYTEAKDYYQEFVEIAPQDNLKYVLKYEISKAEGADNNTLISILEELKEQEYSEEWAYELACLYHKAGMSDKCIETCDELILWFGDGPYVENALELKMLYQPLSKQQEEKYRQFRLNRDGVVEVNPKDALISGEIVNETVQIPDVKLSPERFNTQNLQEELQKNMQQILYATEKETVDDSMDSIKKLVEDIPYLQLPKEAPAQEESGMPHIATDAEIDNSLRNDFREYLAEDYDGQMSMYVPERGAAEPQVTGQISIDEVLAEWERTRRAAEAALQEAEQRKLESAKARALQEAGDIMGRLADVIPKLNSGLTPRDLLEEQYLAGRPIEDDRAVEMVANMNQILQEEIDRLSNENAIIDERLAAAETGIGTIFGDDIRLTPEEAAALGVGGGMRELFADIPSFSEEITEEEVYPEEIAEETVFPEEIVEETVYPEEIAEETVSPEEIAEESAVSSEPAGEPILRGDLIPREEEAVIPSESAVYEEEADEPFDFAKAILSLVDAPEEQASEDAAEDAQKAETAAHTEEQIEAAILAQTTRNLQEDFRNGRRDDILPEIALPEGILPEIEEPEEVGDAKVIQKLSKEQREIFTYFVPIKGMERQLCQAMTGTIRRLSAGGSAATGNMVIQGGQGSGKTVLATSMIKALQKEIGKPKGAVGKIEAAALNQKDIPALMKKVAGGCLIIERAGGISKETAELLSDCLAHDTSGVLLIMEDTHKGIEKALSRDAGFAARFSEKINIPIFTSDELVAFAKSYANELGYTIDEMGVLALYNSISNIQKLDKATTLTEVKDIVDDAIARAERGGLKKAFSIISSRRYDDDDYVILHEKDFGF